MCNTNASLCIMLYIVLPRETLLFLYPLHCFSNLTLFFYLQIKAKAKENCVFEEVYAANHYTEFRSMISTGKHKWGLGFTKKGSGRKGRRVKPNGRAGQFLERPLRLVINLQDSSKNNGSGIKGLQEHIARLLKVYQDKLWVRFI